MTEMFGHGIHSSTADFWVHFHPADHMIYTYAVPSMLWYIDYCKPPVHVGRSKDGIATGAGYLIQKQTFFIIPSIFRTPSFPWASMTDREAGSLGEKLVRVAIDAGVIDFPTRRTTTATGEQQFDGVDVVMIFERIWSVEIKTERYKSANLFVQTGERDHRVNIASVDGALTHRFTQPDWERRGP
jgi:hypothetical protein